MPTNASTHAHRHTHKHKHKHALTQLIEYAICASVSDRWLKLLFDNCETEPAALDQIQHLTRTLLDCVQKDVDRKLEKVIGEQWKGGAGERGRGERDVRIHP